MFPMSQTICIDENAAPVGTGWLPPLPDFRDFTSEKPEIATLTKKLGIRKSGPKAPPVPETVDLSEWCSPIENQKSLGACSAHAAVGIIEYFEKRAHNKHIDGSRLFVYKATRNLMGVKGDTGAWLRNAMAALALCGVPPEKFWPYTDADPDFDSEPTAFVYAVADNYEAIRYFCHDPIQKAVTPDKVLASVKQHLAAGIPSMFGFYGFPSVSKSDTPGCIPFPGPEEKAQWGHAVVAVGYDDNKKITNTESGYETTGALKIRNSWGVEWGEGGYGWLPYTFALNRLAIDFWSLVKMEWVDTREFGL